MLQVIVLIIKNYYPDNIVKYYIKAECIRHDIFIRRDVC